MWNLLSFRESCDPIAGRRREASHQIGASAPSRATLARWPGRGAEDGPEPPGKKE